MNANDIMVNPFPIAPASFRQLANRTRREKFRLVFALIPALYLLTLTGFVVYRSSNRTSVLSAINNDAATLPENMSDQSAGVLSKLLLEDFHRVEVKNGRPVWEIRAKDAKYFPKDLVIHVNEAQLKIYSEKRGVRVKAEAAKLYRSETSLARAALDGNIVIETGDGMFIHTDSAEFDAVAKVFQAPAGVEIHGEGFSVKGEGFRFYVESGIVSFSRNVQCSFETGAKIPQGLNVPQ